MKEHKFTITSQYRAARTLYGASTVVPFLRIAGQWLEEIGFTRGARVVATAEAGRIVITLAGDAPVVASHSSDRGSNSCDARSHASHRRSDESRLEDSKSDRRSHSSDAASNECDA